ncbi:MAG: SDR family NAD(P)-dependent oxidoreductase, partial [Bacteroidia bacterium]|nr:SDR family NAD(P)-dependent oxidoreductase [Bacteroidia bacterium]
MNPSNKTIVVTGGGNGMGRELTLLLLKKNARVAAVDIRQDALDETVKLAGANNKTIVVTGGGNGMGRELTLLLLKKNARVAAIDIRQDALDETVKLAGANKSRLSTHVLNITDKAAVEQLPEQLIALHGSVDGLINNAGIIQPFVKINDLQYEAIDRVMQVNFYGMLYMSKSFLPHLLKRPEAHIVNISSM